MMNKLQQGYNINHLSFVSLVIAGCSESKAQRLGFKAGLPIRARGSLSSSPTACFIAQWCLLQT